MFDAAIIPADGVYKKMTARCAAPTPKHSYYVICVSYPRREFEGKIYPASRGFVEDADMTLRNVIDQAREVQQSARGDEIVFIHHVHDGGYEDVTEDVTYAATLESVDEIMGSDRQAQAFDHKQDHRKHGEFV